MAKGILKNTGKIITAVMLAFLFSLPVSAAEIKSELSRNRIAAGDSTTLKVMISGTTSDIRPVKMPAIDGLNIALSGTSRSIQIINSNTWMGFILNFTIQAEKKGVYRIPPLVLEADGEMLQTKEFVLTVDEGSAGSALPSGSIRGEVELTAGEIYAGEPVLMRYYVYTENPEIRIEGMKEQPESRGFVIKDLKEISPDEGNGRTYIASYCLVAAESGKHEIGGGVLSVVAEAGDGFFSRIIRREIRFPKKKVNVKALPARGRPAVFNGDVGEFSVEAGEASGSFRAGEEFRIPVKVRGRGNFLMMSKLMVENQEGIKVLVEESEPVLSVDNRTLTGEKGYTVTVIPGREGEYKIGKIFLPYFNPYKGLYERAESLPFSFTASAPAAKKDSGGDKIGDDKKSSMPQVILIAAVIVIAVCGALLYLQTGKYRIVRAEPAHKIKAEPESGTVDQRKFLREEIEKAYADKNHELFLLNAERLAVMIADDSPGNRNSGELAKIMEKINLYRYGGATPSEDGIMEIYSVIKKGF